MCHNTQNRRIVKRETPREFSRYQGHASTWTIPDACMHSNTRGDERVIDATGYLLIQSLADRHIPIIVPCH